MTAEGESLWLSNFQNFKMLFNILKYFLILNSVVTAKITAMPLNTSSVPPLNFYIRQPHCQKQLMNQNQ